MRDVLRRRTARSARASPPRRRSIATATSASGVCADYVARSSAGPGSSSGEPPDAADVRPQPAARQPGRRLARSTGRSSRAAGTERRVDDRIAAHVAERIPNGATIQIGIGGTPNAILAALAATATSASTPSCCPTASSTSSRPACHRRRASASTARRPSARSPSAPSGCTGSSTTTRRRALAGALRQRPAGHRRRAGLRVDQLDPDRRSARPVRVGDRRRPLLLLERRAGGLRPRGDVLRRAGRAFVVLHSTTRDGTSRRSARRSRPATSSRRSRTPSTRSPPSGAYAELRGRPSWHGPRRCRHRPTPITAAAPREGRRLGYL